MRNQTKYLFIYLCVLCLLIGSVVRLAQAQETLNNAEQQGAELSQVTMSEAELEQLLAPIALYPDTLLSHILVASTYPLEVVQAARWRAANNDLDEQQALDAAEEKGWDPSVQALVPFNDLLQKLSADLDWLQTLGNAFLLNEEQLLASVQSLRQQAYQEGNLNDNEYMDIAQEDGEIVIETVRKEIVYVPYYDTRVVYGNWRWHHHQPYYWHRPINSIFRAGFYWSIGFNIRPSFYFGGFHWHNRHLVSNYHYRLHAGKHWTHKKRHQRVKVKEFQRWTHNPQHRKGAQYKLKGQHVVVRSHGGTNHYTKSNKINKQRVLNASHYQKKSHKNDAARIKQTLAKQSAKAQNRVVVSDKSRSVNKSVNNKQRMINQQKSQQRQKLNNNYTSNKVAKASSKQRSDSGTQRYKSSNKQSSQKQRTSNKNNQSAYKQKSTNKSYRASTTKQKKSRQVNIARNDQKR